MGSLPNIEIHLGDSIPFLWEKFSAVLGKDALTADIKTWFSTLQRRAFLDASTVQCIGMHTPLPIHQIYRPTKLRWKSTFAIKGVAGEQQHVILPTSDINPASLLSTPVDALIVAGPGYGKTTLLHHMFLSCARSDCFAPVLITLRRPGAVEDLCRLVDYIKPLKRVLGVTELVLLVDGYDEIDLNKRRLVSHKLLEYSASEFGRYYVACREFYDVYDLKIPQIYVAPFDETDQEIYIKTFAMAYGSLINAREVLQDLRKRKLDDLLEHPLLLALICIVRSGALSLHSRSVLTLIERALDTLSFRWDEGKGLARDQVTPVDGRSRIHCLMRVAYSSPSTHIRDKDVLVQTEKQLKLQRWDSIDPRVVAMETARFYGILVPQDESTWKFVHRTLQDYLAAKFWVEKSRFDPQLIREWDTRAAYAASLGPDATTSMISALSKKESISAFVEMLSNEAPFDYPTVCNALIAHHERFSTSDYYTEEQNHIISVLEVDYVSPGPTKFLQELSLACCLGETTRTKNTLFSYVAIELSERGAHLTNLAYSIALTRFGPDAKFNVKRFGEWKGATLALLTPTSKMLFKDTQ